jgi:endonuclease G
MEFTQVFTDEDVKQEFLDRFDELADAAQLAGGLEGLEGLEAGPSRRDAEKAVDAMAEGVYQPDDSGLEAIVQRFTRPVHLVHGAGFDPPTDNFPESETIQERLAAAAGRLGEAIPSSGRIDLRNHRLAWVGTAWKVAPNVVVTNRHVAEEFARPGGGGFVFRKSFDKRVVRASVDWRREYNEAAESIFRVSKVLWIEPDGSPEVALLEIDGEGENGEAQPPIIPLMTAEEYQAATVGRWLAVIGYPAQDSRYDAADQQRIFDGIYDVKRLASGKITAMPGAELVKHDATTLGGNSGSAVVDLCSGKAMALHFGGIQGVANWAVPAPRVRQILDKRLS